MFKIPWQNTATDENKKQFWSYRSLSLSLFLLHKCMNDTHVRTYNQPLWNGPQLWNTPHWQTVQTERGQTRWTTAQIFAQRHPTHVFSQCTIAYVRLFTETASICPAVSVALILQNLLKAHLNSMSSNKFLEDEGLSWLDMSDSPHEWQMVGYGKILANLVVWTQDFPIFRRRQIQIDQSDYVFPLTCSMYILLYRWTCIPSCLCDSKYARNIKLLASLTNNALHSF